ncbi:MAG: matrixin family metalloprotease [Gammaproteobacteria bacterium]|nr:matrixin family metalloprotease [Gammaproteobacteria bacterium]
MINQIFRYVIVVLLLNILCLKLSFAGDVNQMVSNGERYEVKWDERLLPYRWTINEQGAAGQNISKEQLVSSLKKSFQKWQSIPTANVTFEFAGESVATNGSQDGAVLSNIDGLNLITFVDDEFLFQDGVAAVCVTHFLMEDKTFTLDEVDLNGDGEADIPEGTYKAGTIIDADIIFNGQVDFSKLAYNSTSGDELSVLERVALHESGHCSGLDHSSVEASVMYPIASFTDNTVSGPHSDDIISLSNIYPNEEQFALEYGTISGQIVDGSYGIGIVGAHIHAINASTREIVKGTLSLTNGFYELVVPPGDYFIKVEPLDSSKIGLEPKRFNDYIMNNVFYDFPSEYYDENESAVELGSETPTLITIFSGQNKTGVDFKSNVSTPSGMTYSIVKGANYFSYPQKVPETLTSFEFLRKIRSAIEVNRIQRFNTDTGAFDQTVIINNKAHGHDFAIKEGEGYILNSSSEGQLQFPGQAICPKLDLKNGFNIVGAHCVPPNFSSYDFIKALGTYYEVESIESFNQETEQFDKTFYEHEQPAGIEFDIIEGQAYVVRMLQTKLGVKPFDDIVTAPLITMLSPGVGFYGTEIVLFGKGFSIEKEDNLVLFDEFPAEVLYASPERLLVKVPNDIGYGNKQITINIKELSSNSVDFYIERQMVDENEHGVTNLISGQTARGSISNIGEQDLYTFSAVSGAKATLSARSTSGNGLDLKLELLSPSGVVIASDDNSGFANNAKITNQLLQESGTYTAIVSAEGTGTYEFDLQVSNEKTKARVEILSGSVQVAASGSQLGEPIIFQVLDERGEAIANAEVGLSVTSLNNESEQSKKAVNTSSNMQKSNGAVLRKGLNVNNTIRTNKYGIAAVEATVPDEHGNYEISINIPGISDAISSPIEVVVVKHPIKTIEVTQRTQDCNGQGCEVGKALPEDWVITFKDRFGQGISGVPVQWQVVSGDGFVQGLLKKADKRSEADGSVRMSQTLGKKLYQNPTHEILRGDVELLPQYHIVAATVPGQSAPILFEGIAGAGEVSQVQQFSVPSLSIGLGSVRANAVMFMAKDQYGNPVADEVVSYNSEYTGIDVSPGIFNRKQMPSMLTNERGIWVGAIGAIAKPVAGYLYFDHRFSKDPAELPVRPGAAIPTIDEFGNRDTVGLHPTYMLSFNIASKTIELPVDVDMGPTVVAYSESDNPGALIGQSIDLENNSESRPTFSLFFFSRIDGEDDDTDQYLSKSIVNETDFTRLIQIFGWSQSANLSVRYDIGNENSVEVLESDKAKLEYENMMQCPNNTCPTGDEWLHVNIFDGETALQYIKGHAHLTTIGNTKTNGVYVVANFGEQKSVILKSYYCNGNALDQSCNDDRVFEKTINFGDKPMAYLLNVEPISIKIEIEDPTEQEVSTSDPYPGVPAVSGINLKSFKIKLNGNEIDLNSLELGKYPHYAKIVMDEKIVKNYGTEVTESSKPRKWQFIYYPKADELQDSNILTIEGIDGNTSVKDAAGNFKENPPEVEVTCNFEFPAENIVCAQ